MLEDCLNDAFDNIEEKNRNNQISLLYEANKTNMVAVKTAVGLTKRINMPNIVQQGGTWGPLLCSNSIDKIGKKHSPPLKVTRELLLNMQTLQNLSLGTH